jgi:hypothetical protein
MGLVFSDGFDQYSTSTDLLRNWASNGWTWGSTSGHTGAGGITTTASAQNIVTNSALLATASGATFGILLWLKISAIPASTVQLIQMLNAAAGTQGTVRINSSTGFLAHYNQGGAQQVVGSVNVCDGNWHWLSIRMPYGTANGQCYLDGSATPQWNTTIANGTNGTTVDHLQISSSATGNYAISDIIIIDDTVAQSPQTSDLPIGPRQIDTLKPASDATVQWTTSSGSNHYALVNETAADDDISYVQDNVSGHQDTFNMASLGFSPATITAVQFVHRVKNSSGGSQTYKARCVSGATTNDGASLTAPAAYGNNRTLYNRDPNTSAAWTPTNLAAAKFGVVIP